MDLVLLVIGFILLVKGADLFVSGASSIAKRLGIPSLVIGLSLVAMGTSAPELAVSVSAALKGSNQIALANVTGSNIFNLLGVLGICAVIKPFRVKNQVVKKEYPFNIFSTLLLFLLVVEVFLSGGSTAGLSRADGLILVLVFILYMYSTFYGLKKDEVEEGEEIKVYPMSKSLILTVVGLAFVILGGDLVVDSAIEIARFLGMSENLIGISIISIGTSLPELVTSVVATKKGQVDIAVGNVVGSNIFNILFVLGVSVSISGISIIMVDFIDLIFLLIVTLICMVLIITNKKVSRREGIFMILLYLGYMAYAIVR